MLRRNLARQGLRSGMNKGWHGFVWMMKILVPISLATALLSWSGWLERVQFIFQPVMTWLSLPAAAALPLLIGLLTSIYGAIAAMAMIPFSKAHMTLIAIFLCIAHALIQEGVIQGKSGLNPFKAALVRLAAATAAVMVSALFLETGSPIGIRTAAALEAGQPLAAMLHEWLLTTIRLGVKIFIIIMSVLVLLELARALGWIDRFVKICKPLLSLMGLSEKAGVIWMTSAIFGLSYGAAVIVEEAREGRFTKAELESVHVSIGINHALIEDPALFMALGLNPFWLWVPRLLAAILVVRLLALWQRFGMRGRRPAG